MQETHKKKAVIILQVTLAAFHHALSSLNGMIKNSKQFERCVRIYRQEHSHLHITHYVQYMLTQALTHMCNHTLRMMSFVKQKQPQFYVFGKLESKVD